MLFMDTVFKFIGLRDKTETKNIGRPLLLLEIQCKNTIDEWYIYNINQNIVRICKCMMKKLIKKNKDYKYYNWFIMYGELLFGNMKKW